MDDQTTRRRVLLRLSAWFGLATFGSSQRALLAANSRKQDPQKTDPLPREVVAEVTLPARRFAVGETIPFTFTITNNSPRAVVIWSSGFWPNHLIEVWDAAGQTPPLTQAGKLRRRSFAPAGARRMNIPVKLNPGESYPRPREGEDPAKPVVSGGLGLDRLFELKPGTFKVRVTYHDEQSPTPLKVVSPEVAFEVIPPEAERQDSPAPDPKDP